MTETFLIRPVDRQPLLNFRELWKFRYLFYVLVWRTLRVRYQQTIIGVGWAVLQPLLLVFVFTFIFGLIAGMPSHGQPYPVFVISGLIIWLFVAQALNQASTSMVGNAHLITRIYFPRVILIFTAITVAFVDFLCAFALLLLMMMWYGVAPSAGVLYFPAALLLAVLTVLGMSLWLSALYVPYRDVGHVLPFLIQLWMFLSPVIYPSTLLPPKYQFLYSLNPIVVAIDTSRWGFAGGPQPQLWMVGVSSATVAVLCLTGFWFFRRQEATFADVV